MNQDQVLALIRAIMLGVGTIAVSQGIANAGQWQALTTAVLTISGAILTIWPIIWAMYRHSKEGQIKAVAAMPETKVDKGGTVIEVKDTKLAQAAQAAATPNTAGDLK
jgi:hypothetical protein